MLFKSIILASLAATAITAPVSEDPAATSLQEKRQSTADPGVFIMYPETSFSGGGTAFYQPSGQKQFCQQFQPTFKGKVGFKSYLTQNISFLGWNNTNCAGNAEVVVQSVAQNTLSNVNYQNLLSFQLIYLK